MKFQLLAVFVATLSICSSVLAGPSGPKRETMKEMTSELDMDDNDIYYNPHRSSFDQGHYRFVFEVQRKPQDKSRGVSFILENKEAGHDKTAQYIDLGTVWDTQVETGDERDCKKTKKPVEKKHFLSKSSVKDVECKGDEKLDALLQVNQGDKINQAGTGFKVIQYSPTEETVVHMVAVAQKTKVERKAWMDKHYTKITYVVFVDMPNMPEHVQISARDTYVYRRFKTKQQISTVTGENNREETFADKCRSITDKYGRVMKECYDQAKQQWVKTMPAKVHPEAAAHVKDKEVWYDAQDRETPSGDEASFKEGPSPASEPTPKRGYRDRFRDYTSNLRYRNHREEQAIVRIQESDNKSWTLASLNSKISLYRNLSINQSIKALGTKRILFSDPSMAYWPTETNDPLYKYYNQRHALFTRFDEGIQLDKEAWYSVTPEPIAEHIAHRCACPVIMDAFCGAGGNAIQLAMTCSRVIAIDCHAERLAMAQHNARVYGVEDKIEFVLGDYFDLGPTFQVDGVFLSPPWGGPDYNLQPFYDLNHLEPRPAQDLIEFTRGNVSKNICLFLPRNANLQQVRGLVTPPDTFDLEQHQLLGKVKAISVYFGERFRVRN